MSLLTATLATKIAIGVLAGGVAATGATAAAAYAGALPVALQQAAHDTIGAPEPTQTDATPIDATSTPDPTTAPTSTATPGPTAAPDPTAAPEAGGPDATGPAAFGLCNAFTHGGLSATSTAYAALLKAAGDAGAITSYCATIPRPGDSARRSATSEPTPHATPGAKGRPSDHKPATPDNTKRPDATGD